MAFFLEVKCCVCAIPELLLGKSVTRAGLRTPSAWLHFKPGDSRGVGKVALEMQVRDTVAQELWQKQCYENPPKLGIIKHFLIILVSFPVDSSLHRLGWRSKFKKRKNMSLDRLQITLSSSCILLYHVNTHRDSSLHGSQSDFAYSYSFVCQASIWLKVTAQKLCPLLLFHVEKQLLCQQEKSHSNIQFTLYTNGQATWLEDW